MRIKRFATAVDTEGHRGIDGKFYLLDFSRTMPPVDPLLPTPVTFFGGGGEEVEEERGGEVVQNGHLFRLFRREFVRMYEKPLCPDAYSVSFCYFLCGFFFVFVLFFFCFFCLD